MRFISIVLQEVRSSRLRALITGLSMLLGVVAVSGGVACLGAVTDYLVAEQERVSGREYTFRAELPKSQELISEISSRTAAQARSGSWAVAVEVSDSALLIHESSITRVTIAWMTEDPNRIYRRPLISGQSEHLGESLAASFTINQRLADAAGIDSTPRLALMQKGDIGVRALITGIRDDGSDEFNAYGRFRDAALVNPLVGDLDATIKVTALAHSSEDVDLLIQGACRHSGFGQGVTSQRVDSVEIARTQGAQISGILIGFGLLVLLISALGILNVGLSSVRERSRELAIRRAFGATRLQIFGQVVGGAVLISFFVATFGSVLLLLITSGAIPTRLTTEAALEISEIPWRAVGWGMVAALSTAVVGSVVPAWRATLRPVASVLRS